MYGQQGNEPPKKKAKSSHSFGPRCRNGKCANDFKSATVLAKQLRSKDPSLKWTDAISLSYCQIRGTETAHCKALKARRSGGAGAKKKMPKAKGKQGKSCPKGHAVCNCK
jgi:hypothetical protein